MSGLQKWKSPARWRGFSKVDDEKSDRHYAAGRDRNRRAQEALQHEDALGMMAQRTMPKISGDRFRLVEPLMQWQKVLGGPAPFLHRGEGVVIAMSHCRPLKTRAGNSRTPCAARCSRA